jgi:hypothetical protein
MSNPLLWTRWSILFPVAFGNDYPSRGTEQEITPTNAQSQEESLNANREMGNSSDLHRGCRLLDSAITSQGRVATIGQGY